jgi:hypothetical protein
MRALRGNLQAKNCSNNQTDAKVMYPHDSKLQAHVSAPNRNLRFSRELYPFWMYPYPFG